MIQGNNNKDKRMILKNREKYIYIEITNIKNNIKIKSKSE